MPAQKRSLQLTDAYRRRLLSIGDRVERQARQAWPSIENFDGTDWPERTARLLTRAQTEAVRLTAGYLAAFLRSETGSGTVPAIDSRKYAGVSRDGRPLAEALVSPLIGVRSALKDGRGSSVALKLGLSRGLRTVRFEATQAARDALLDTIEADERFTDHQRAVAGTCAACMALSGTGGPQFEVHPGCQCVPMPVVRGVTQRVLLPTGAALFAAMAKEDQERAIGPEAAELVRSGDADLQDFVSHSSIATTDDYLTQKPVEEVAPQT